MKVAYLLAFLSLASSLVGAQDVIGDFTHSPNEHIVNEVNEPFVVRSIKGYIHVDGGSDMPLSDVLFEIQGPGSSRIIRRTKTDASGRFKLRHVPNGRYRFKATLMSFQSVMGTLVVSKSARKSAEIQLGLPVGV